MMHTSVLCRPYLIVVVCLGLAACGGGGGNGPSTTAPPPNPLYVRASGNDTNSGADKNNALRTIARAAQIARSGYEIIVGPGTYTGGITGARVGTAPDGLIVRADPSGRETGDQAAAVVVDATGAKPSAGFSLSGIPGGIIDGFTITGGNDAGIVLKSGSDDFTIQNCIVFSNGGDGIRVQDSQSVLIFNNLVYRNGGTGLVVAGSGSGSKDARVYSNTIVANAGRGVTIGNTDAASSGALVTNNILQGNGSDANIKVFTTPRSEVGFVSSFNLVFPPTYIPASIAGRFDIDTDARFRNAGSNDFHLLSGSPAIDQNSALVGLPNVQAQILRQRTTTGADLDRGLLDLGYHFLP